MVVTAAAMMNFCVCSFLRVLRTTRMSSSVVDVIMVWSIVFNVQCLLYIWLDCWIVGLEIGGSPQKK